MTIIAGLLTLAAPVSGEAAANDAGGLKVATFAGGCFWCMERPFDALIGVDETVSGYTGGETRNPTYEEVTTGKTGHAEAVRITYDPQKISYDKLLEVFWHNIDPLVKNRQFCDVGSQYRTAVFYHDAEQKKVAEAWRDKLADRFGQPIETEIVPAGPFYRAEEYHQNYYEKNPLRYSLYRMGCGRDARLKELWGDAADAH